MKPIEPANDISSDPLIRRIGRMPRIAPFLGTARYQIVRCIGEGGFGVVYEVEDRELARRLALKTFRATSESFAVHIRRLKTEFRSVADLVHPNLVGLHDLSSDGARWFFTMDLVQGCDFLEYIRGRIALAYAHTTCDATAGAQPQRDTSGVLSEPRLRASLRQLAAGVRALHAAGIIHRDLKPSNVLVEPDGRVLILDFGLAGTPLTFDADVGLQGAGTPAYMAPEQAGGSVTPSADWYAVGVMLYEALAGRLPFDEDGPLVLGMKSKRDPAPPSSYARVPEDLETLCMALLRRQPEERPDGDAILAILETRRRSAARHSGRERPPPSSVVTASSPRCAKPSSRCGAVKRRYASSGASRGWASRR